MFYSEYRHTLDEKNRLSIPAKYRMLLQGSGDDPFFIGRGIDRCILICTKAVWQEMERQFCDHPITNPIARRFNRLFYSGAQEVTLDKQGRIALPQNLIEWSGLKRDVVLAGVSNRIEVWDAQTWDAQLAESLEAFEATASELWKPSGQ
ncbi:MAG: division/cell wall cluster transcriptional repressor MraZ [Verrucomicrobia bacterium]|nr:division/cell wall cluster transcriptional repressor MraZ [Verrucomicrobiota bacterium]